MKTSNKLLIGLIVAIFLFVTIFIGIAKYYQVSAAGEAYHGNRNVSAEEITFSQKEAILTTVIFSPVIFLQLPR